MYKRLVGEKHAAAGLTSFKSLLEFAMNLLPNGFLL